MSASSMHKMFLGTAAAAVMALAAGCGSSSSNTPASGGSTTPTSSATTGSASSLKTASTSIGTVLVDSSGRTVYELVGDSVAKPTCTGGCLSAWPAVKANGTQVVVNGHPVYTYTDDTAAGQTKGQGVTDQWGRWWALDAQGNPITTPTAKATTSAPAGGGPAF